MRRLLLIFALLSCYSYGADQWTQKADFGSFGRHRGAAMSIGTKAYCGLGHLNGTGIDTWHDDWWEYNPANDIWTQMADYPGNNGTGDQDVVAVGFETYGFAGLGWLDGNNFYKFDPSLNQWTSATNPPAAFNFNDVTPFGIDGKAYFGALYSSAFFEYDPTTDMWTQLNDLPFTTSFGIPSFVINDKGYFKDGVSLWEYKPSTDTWLLRAPFPGLTPDRPKGFSQHGYGYIIGGMDATWTWSSEVWRFDPETNSWFQLDDFPGATRRWALTMNVGEKVFYGLGTDGTNFNDFWEFNSLAAVGMDENSKSQFTVYPTLISDVFRVQSDDYSMFEFQLHDVNGKMIRNSMSSNGVIHMRRDGLPAGTYYYQIIVDGLVSTSDKLVFR